MTGVAKLNVVEEPQRLLELMNQQKTALGFAKVQSLYLWKIGAVETVRHLAVLVGRTERTIYRWLEIYRDSGIKELLKEKPKTGRPKKLTIEQVSKLQQELRDPKGFKSYKEVQVWIFIFCEIWLNYSTVHRLVNQELKAKLKVVRPKNKKQLPGEVEEFKSTLTIKLKSLLDKGCELIDNYKKVSFWCSDETRLGLHTIQRKKITLKGVKPVDIHQFNFQCFWLYGAIEPKEGRSFFYEFSHLDAACFSQYLSLLSQEFPDELLVILLDNAPAHTSEEVEVPDNIILFFQPPYCPEVNAIERFWEYLKQDLAWELCESLDSLRAKVDTILNSLSQEVVGTLTGWHWILQSLCMSGL